MIQRKLNLLGVLLLSGALFAQSPSVHGLRKELGLTDDQVKQLRDLRKQQAEQLKPQRDQVRSGAENLRSLMAAPNPDPTAVGKQVLDLRQARTALRQARSAWNDKAKAILTPEQQNRLSEIQAKRHRSRPRAGVL